MEKETKRKPKSEQWCQNLSLALKGRSVWNKGKKGLQKAWNKIEIPKDWLYQKYIIENKSISQIATKSNLSRSTILRKLVEYNIQRKSSKDYFSGAKYAQFYGSRIPEIKNKISLKLKGRKNTWGDKISKSLKERYKKYGVRPEVKLKRKEIAKKLWQSPEFRQKLIDAHRGQQAWNKGKTGIYSPEVRLRMSSSHLGKKIIFTEAHKKKLSEASKRRFLEHREFLKQLARPHLTHVEKKIRDFLQQQHFIEGRDFFYDEFDLLGDTLYRPDFQFPNQKVIIEVDGFYKHFTENGRQKDKKRDEELRKAGWQIHRFTQKNILKNFDGVKANILNIFNKPDEQNILELT